MRSLLVLTFPLLFVSASAFSFTSKPADGVYAVSVDAEGNEVHQPLTEDMILRIAPEGANIINATASSGVSKRADNTWCGCGYGMDHGSCDAAVDDLKRQLGTGAYITAPYQSFYSVRGSVVAFVCNFHYDTTFFYANADYFGQSAARITDSCGWYIAGSEGYQARTDIATLGYMNFATGTDFCGNALSSPAHSCPK
jgi:hypothetical protein